MESSDGSHALGSTMTTSVGSSGTSNPVTEMRRAELLQSARRSRLRWVLQAKETDTVTRNPSRVSSEVRSTVDLETIVHRIPGAVCVQHMLDFFRDVVDDGEHVDLSSLLLTIQDEEDDIDAALVTFQAQQYSASSYELFLQKLLHPQASSVVKALQHFITKFIANKCRSSALSTSLLYANELDPKMMLKPSTESRNGSFDSSSNDPPMINKPFSMIRKTRKEEEEDQAMKYSTEIFEFLGHLYSTMTENPFWNTDDAVQRDLAHLNAERFVLIKLYPFLFGIDSEDEVVDKQTRERIASLSFLRSEHLDIRSFAHLSNINSRESKNDVQRDPLYQLLLKPIQSLIEMTEKKSPIDKLTALRQCSTQIAQLLTDLRKKSDGSLPGADELLPVMILCIKYANPPNLHAELKYLQRYTHPSKLMSEAGYLITSFGSAVLFLDTVDAQALTIDPEEFDASMRAAKAHAREEVKTQASRLRDNISRHTKEAQENDNEQVNCEKLLEEYRNQCKTLAETEFRPLHSIAQSYGILGRHS